MPRIGRPRSDRAASAQIVRIKLRLYPGEDDDLIAFFAEVPRGLRALSVKTALRSGVQSAEGEANRTDDALLDSLEGFVF
jgi:hypothetical protein